MRFRVANTAFYQYTYDIASIFIQSGKPTDDDILIYDEQKRMWVFSPSNQAAIEDVYQLLETDYYDKTEVDSLIEGINTISLSDGTLLQPSLSFNNDSSTGMYRNEQGDIVFVYNTFPSSFYNDTRFHFNSILSSSLFEITQIEYDTNTGLPISIDSASKFVYDNGGTSLQLSDNEEVMYINNESIHINHPFRYTYEGLTPVPRSVLVSDDQGNATWSTDFLGISYNESNDTTTIDNNVSITGDFYLPPGADGYVLMSDENGKGTWTELPPPPDVNEIQLNDGSVITPSLRFINEPTLGVSRVHDQEISFSSENNTIGKIQYFPSIYLHNITTLSGGVSSDLKGVLRSLSISYDGTRVVVGASGYDSPNTNAGLAQVFEYNGTGYVQIGGDMVGSYVEDRLGNPTIISPDGNMVCLASLKDDSGNVVGQVDIFTYDGSGWVYIQTLEGTEIGEQFGYSLSMSRTPQRLVIGSMNSKVHVYKFVSGLWVLETTLTKPGIGYSVVVSDDGSLIVTGKSITGTVEVYERDGNGSWQNTHTITTPKASASDYGTIDVDITFDKSTLVIGTPSLRTCFVYKYVNGGWTEFTTFFENVDRFGNSVTITGDGRYIGVGASAYNGVADVVYYYFDPTTNVYVQTTRSIPFIQLGPYVRISKEAMVTVYSHYSSSSFGVVFIQRMSLETTGKVSSGMIETYNSEYPLGEEYSLWCRLYIRHFFRNPTNPVVFTRSVLKLNTQLFDIRHDSLDDNDEGNLPLRIDFGTTKIVEIRNFNFIVSKLGIRYLEFLINENVVNILELKTTTATITGKILLPSGSVTELPIRFSLDLNTGFYLSNPDEISIVCGGLRTLVAHTNGTYFLDGNVSTPSISFINDPSTGIYSSSNGIIDFTNNGGNSMRISTSEILAEKNFRVIDGTVSNPAITFTSETNTGLYRSTTNRLDFAVNGNNPLSLRNNDTYVLGDIHIPSGAVNGYVLTSNESGRGVWEPIPGTLGFDDGSIGNPSLFFKSNPMLGLYLADSVSDIVGVSGSLSVSPTTLKWFLKGFFTGNSTNDFFGESIAISSDGLIVAVGAPGNGAGYVRVFQWNGTTWEPKGGDIIGSVANDSFGSSIALSSDGLIVAVGAPGNGAGYVRVVQWNGTSWVQKGGDIIGSIVDNDDSFGSSIALSSDGLIVAVGAYRSNLFDGRVRVFEWIVPSWEQKGVSINGTDKQQLGFSVDLSSDGLTIAIGSPKAKKFLSVVGLVEIYKWSTSSTYTNSVSIEGDTYNENLGYSVSLSGDGSILAVGAPNYNHLGNINTGYVKVYEESGTSWVLKGGNIIGDNAGDEFGYSVALSVDGTTLSIGTPLYDSLDGYFTGYVKVFEFDTNSTSWVQKGVNIVGDNAGDYLGYSVALSGNGSILAIGVNRYNTETGLLNVYEYGIFPIERFVVTDTLTHIDTKLRVNEIEGNDEIGKKNYIRINGTSDVQQFLRFRLGGNSNGKSGINFSSYDNNNFFVFAEDGNLKINWVDNPETNTLNVGTEIVRFTNTSLQLQDGSVSSPSLNFLSSTTTGIFRVAADVIGVSISGAERVRLPTQGIRLTCPNSYADNRFIYTQWDDGSNDHSIGFEFDYFAGSGDPTNLNHSRIMVVANNVVGEEIYNAGRKALSMFYSDGRFQTFNTSGQIKCELHPSNGIYNYGDNTNEHVRIRHDGSNGYITWNTGDLYINNNTTEVARFTTAKSLRFTDNLNVPNIYLWTGGNTANYYAMGVKSGTTVFTGGSTAINYDFRMGATNNTDIGSGSLIGRISNTGIYALNGSAASPSLSFLNATNTGFYYTTSPTATIGMAMGGANIMEYTVNGFYFNYSGGIRMKFEFGSGIWHYGNTTAKYIFIQHDGGDAVIRWNTGSIFVQRLGSTAGVVLGPTSTAWASASDRRLKKNIQEVEPVLEKLKHIKSYKYSLNCEECPDNKPTKYGFMADEVEPYFPEVIETIDTTENTKALRYTEMVPILCKGIVELDEKCVSLENEVSELRTENEQLKSKVSTLETENKVNEQLKSDNEQLKSDNEQLQNKINVLENEIVNLKTDLYSIIQRLTLLERTTTTTDTFN